MNFDQSFPKFPAFDNFDEDESYIQSNSSKYYNLSDLTKLNFPFGKSFSLFHVNTRSLSKNFDQLLSILSASNISFDVLGITKTKQKIDKGFLTNVSIDGYHMYTQPSKSLAGGVAIYVNNKSLGGFHLDRHNLMELRVLGLMRIGIIRQ